MAKPNVDNLGKTTYEEATGEGTLSNPYIPVVNLGGASNLTVNLPAGGATSANQVTTNTTLTNIDNKLPTLISGRLPVDIRKKLSKHILIYA